MTLALSQLPGGDLVEQGLRDQKLGKVTVESCLVKMISPTLQRFKLVDEISEEHDTELILYRILQKSSTNPYSTYNSLIRRLYSFQKSLSLQSN